MSQTDALTRIAADLADICKHLRAEEPAVALLVAQKLVTDLPTVIAQ